MSTFQDGMDTDEVWETIMELLSHNVSMAKVFTNRAEENWETGSASSAKFSNSITNRNRSTFPG